MGRILELYRQAYRGLSPEVWRLSFVAFINRSGTMVVPFLTLWLTQEKGLSPGHAGTLLALYGLGGLVGTYLGGELSDRLPPRRIQIVSLAATGGLFLLLGTLSDPWMLAVTLAVLGLVGESFRPANSTSLTHWSTPRTRGRSFALRRLAVNLGMSFGPAAGGILAMVSYGWLFVVDGATCLLAAVAMTRLLPDEVRSPTPAGRSSEAVDVQGEPEAKAAGRRDAAVPDRSPWRDPPFLVFLALVGGLTLIVFQFASTWPLTLHELYGLTEAKIGLLIAVNTLVIVAFEMVLIHAVQGADHLRLMSVGAISIGLGFALLPFGSTFAFAAVTVLLWTFGEMLSFPLAEAVTAARAGKSNPGRYLGLFATAFGLSFALAQLVGPWVYQVAGPTVLWLGAGALGGAVAVGFWRLAPRMREG